jgi:uncharacterized membrane protein YeaQ/YmgE (transglycosylase-associated protein family)
MFLIWWIIVGLIAGFLTGKLMKGSGFGPLMDIVVGGHSYFDRSSRQRWKQAKSVTTIAHIYCSTVAGSNFFCR